MASIAGDQWQQSILRRFFILIFNRYLASLTMLSYACACILWQSQSHYAPKDSTAFYRDNTLLSLSTRQLGVTTTNTVTTLSEHQFEFSFTKEVEDAETQRLSAEVDHRSWWQFWSSAAGSSKREWKRELVLHIGPWKTGTTHIQTCLAKNSKALLSSGISYDLLDDDGAHHYLAPCIQAHVSGRQGACIAKHKIMTENLYNHLRDGGGNATTLLSSESIFNLGAASISYLNRWAHTHRVKLIMFHRNCASAQWSGYKHELRTNKDFGHQKSLTFWFGEDNLEARCGNGLAAKVANWRIVFGNQSLTIMSYERAKHKGEIADAVLRAIGVQFQSQRCDKRNMADTEGSGLANEEVPYRQLHSAMRALSLKSKRPDLAWPGNTSWCHHWTNFKSWPLTKAQDIMPIRCHNTSQILWRTTEKDNQFYSAFSEIFVDRPHPPEEAWFPERFCELDVMQYYSTGWQLTESILQAMPKHPCNADDAPVEALGVCLSCSFSKKKDRSR